MFTNISGTTSTNSVIIVTDCPYLDISEIHERQAYEQTNSLITLKFDVVRNEFKLMPGFFCDKAGGFEFVDMNDSLTLIVYEYNNYPFSELMLNLFSLDGEKGCCVWSKIYSIGPFNRWFNCGGIGVCGEIVFHDWGKFCCYGRKTNTIYKLLNTSSTTANTNDSRISCFRYTPSLLS